MDVGLIRYKNTLFIKDVHSPWIAELRGKKQFISIQSDNILASYHLYYFFSLSLCPVPFNLSFCQNYTQDDLPSFLYLDLYGPVRKKTWQICVAIKQSQSEVGSLIVRYSQKMKKNKRNLFSILLRTTQFSCIFRN